MAKCLAIHKVCQRADERQDYAFNWTLEFSNRWQADFPYAANSRVRPTAPPDPNKSSRATGFEYNSSGGVSGATEPDWPITLGGTVTDGSITWTAVAMSNAGLRHRISGASVWTADAGITLESQTTTDAPGLQESRIWVKDGTVGQTYHNIVTVTTTPEGAEYQAELEVKIEA